MSDHESDPDFEWDLPRSRHSLRSRRPMFVVKESDESEDVPFVPVSTRKRVKASPKPRPKPAPRRKPAKKKRVLLAEDVPWKPPVPENPTPDPVDASHAPSIAFLCIFVHTFAEAFDGFEVGPRELEEGIQGVHPSLPVLRLFTKLLALVLNRKKDVEVDRYASALQELHSLRGILGIGNGFPTIHWKSKDAFTELEWDDRLEFLHVLAHWALAVSERIRTILWQLDDSDTKPWIGIGPGNSRYYAIHVNGQFSVFRESSPLLSVVTWQPVASNATQLRELVESLCSDVLPKPEPEVLEAPANSEGIQNENQDQGSAEKEDPAENVNQEKAEDEDKVKSEAENEPENDEENGDQNNADNDEQNADENEYDDDQDGEQDTQSKEQTPNGSEEQTNGVDPNTRALAAALAELLPGLEEEERSVAVRAQKDARRRAKQLELERHAEFLRQTGGRHRTRRTEIDFAAMFAEPESDSDSGAGGRRRRRLRARDSTWMPQEDSDEPREESRQERYERLARDRAARVESEGVEQDHESAGQYEMEVDDISNTANASDQSQPTHELSSQAPLEVQYEGTHHQHHQDQPRQIQAQPPQLGQDSPMVSSEPVNSPLKSSQSPSQPSQPRSLATPDTTPQQSSQYTQDSSQGLNQNIQAISPQNVPIQSATHVSIPAPLYPGNPGQQPPQNAPQFSDVYGQHGQMSNQMPSQNPGQFPARAPGQFQGQFPVHYQPDQFPLGQLPPGQLPPGQFLPGGASRHPNPAQIPGQLSPGQYPHQSSGLPSGAQFRGGPPAPAAPQFHGQYTQLGSTGYLNQGPQLGPNGLQAPPTLPGQTPPAPNGSGGSTQPQADA